MENEKPRYHYFEREMRELKEEKKKLLEDINLLWKMYEVRYMRGDMK